MDEVQLVEYDSRWPELFLSEAKRVKSVLPAELVVSVDHFGSTSIPGLAAKPIIDILVSVRSVPEAREIAVQPLASIGYAFWSDNPRRDHLFFVKGLPPAAAHRTHHIHMLEPGSDMRAQLLFRDYLRSHSDEASRYGDLKLELMARHSNDREAYTAAKSTYIDQIIVKARAEKAL